MNAILRTSGHLRQTSLLVTLGFVAALLTGCLSPKSYVDPKFRDATYLSLKPQEKAIPVTVEASFQLNGKEVKRQNQQVRSRVNKVLFNSRVFCEPDVEQRAAAGRLKIVVNDRGNIGSAVGKGMVTGFTFGLVGAKVVDSYAMTAEYTPANGKPLVSKTYEHAIHSTVGVHSAPAGLEPVAMEVAFDQIIEDMLLNFLRDLQKENLL